MSEQIHLHQVLLRDFDIDAAAEYLRFRSKIGFNQCIPVPVRTLSFEDQLKVFEYYGIEFFATKDHNHVHFNDYDDLLYRFQENLHWRLEAEGICQHKPLVITVINGKMIVGHDGKWCLLMTKDAI